jgi:hypothetical protein
LYGRADVGPPRASLAKITTGRMPMMLYVHAGAVLALAVLGLPDEPGAKVPPPTDAQPAPSKDAAAGDVAAARAAAQKRVEDLKDDDKAKDTAGDEMRKELRKLFQERIAQLAALEEATKRRAKAERDALAEQNAAADLRAAAKRAAAELERATRAPESLLPPLFQTKAERVSEAILAEMKEALAAAGEECQAARDRLERLRAESKAASALANLRNEREAIRKALANLTDGQTELDAASAGASTAESREVARERRQNLAWEARVATERQAELDSRIALGETQRGPHLELRIAAQTALAEVARRKLDAIQARYQKLADTQQRDLQRAAAREQARAERSHDPIEQFRANRSAAFLGLQAALLKEEQELAAQSTLSLQEQAELTKQAEADFEGLQKLIEGGRSTTLVGLRLTNSYRRLATERETIVNRELAQASRELSRLENALTQVEFDLLNDSHEDRQLLDKLLARLPKARQAEAIAAHETLEVRHHSLLEERRRVLTQLAERADATRKKILERIQCLDDQHAFIRTHIFWVRDANPIGPTLADQCRHELLALARAILAVAEHGEASAPTALSARYVIALLGLLSLPLAVLRGRRMLNDIVQRDSTPSSSPLVV